MNSVHLLESAIKQFLSDSGANRIGETTSFIEQAIAGKILTSMYTFRAADKSETQLREITELRILLLKLAILACKQSGSEADLQA